MSKVKHTSAEQKLFSDITKLIEQGKGHVAQTVNATLSLLYWQIGKRINEDILNNKRAGYGKQIVASLTRQLTERYGRGWDEKTLRHCLRSAETFSEGVIVSAARRQLGWTHLKTIMYLKDELQRKFYIEMCILERWSTRTLRSKMDGMLYERAAISKWSGVYSKSAFIQGNL